jgi:hypothetical protein
VLVRFKTGVMHCIPSDLSKPFSSFFDVADIKQKVV